MWLIKPEKTLFTVDFGDNAKQIKNTLTKAAYNKRLLVKQKQKIEMLLITLYLSVYSYRLFIKTLKISKASRVGGGIFLSVWNAITFIK